MKTQNIRTCVAGLVLAATLTLTSGLMAADSAAKIEPPRAGESAPPNEAPSNVRHLPFHGKLTSVDPHAKTITLTYTTGDKVFHLTPHTEVLKHEKPAKLEDANLGEQVSGAYIRNGDRAELTKLNLAKKSDDKPEGSKKGGRAKKSKDKAQ
ncbi:MAG: hypothetical protein HY299_15965 [Verrucomicrobia bacterium]|nr:hypothetical protein [Verrucomicrobiota bacterium]